MEKTKYLRMNKEITESGERGCIYEEVVEWCERDDYKKSINVKVWKIGNWRQTAVKILQTAQ